MKRQKSTVRLILEPLAIAVVLAFLVRAAVRIYAIPSASMAPTLAVGDQVLVIRGQSPKRGDVIVFRNPNGTDELLIKRVIATPGDLIDSRVGRVRIGGYTLAEPYLARQAASGAIGAQIVPGDSYFVMGDNRENSHDSRSWGAVPRHLLVGRAHFILWSSATIDGDGQARASTVARVFPSVAPIRSERIFKWID